MPVLELKRRCELHTLPEMDRRRGLHSLLECGGGGGRRVRVLVSLLKRERSVGLAPS